MLKLVEFETVKIILSLKFVKRVAVIKSTTSDWLIFKKQNNDLTIAQKLRKFTFLRFSDWEKNPKSKMETSDDEATLLVSEMLEKLCLATDEERKSLLNEARPHLIAPDASARFKEHLENPDFAIIFDCLNTADESMIKTTCEILSRVFDFVDSKVVIGKYDENLLRALKHPMSEVKEVVLKLLNKGLPFFKQALAVQAGKCLVDKDLSVSKQSHKFIKSLAKFRTYQNHIQIFAEPYLSTIKEMLQNPDEALKLRVLELLVEICR